MTKRELIEALAEYGDDDLVLLKDSMGICTHIERVSRYKWFGENPESGPVIHQGQDKDFT